MKKGFTLLELVVVVVIFLAIIGLVIGGCSSTRSSASDREWDVILNPERAKARALQEANDLKREELELRREEMRQNRAPER